MDPTMNVKSFGSAKMFELFAFVYNVLTDFLNVSPKPKTSGAVNLIVLKRIKRFVKIQKTFIFN